MLVWLSMVLVVAFVFHVWRNWRWVVGFGRRGTLLVPLVLFLALASPVAVVTKNIGGRGGNPAFGPVSVVTPASLSDLAPLLKTTPEALLATLKQQGYQARSIDETLNSIASASGKSISEVLSALLP